MLRKLRAQTTAEYAVLIAVVIGAAVAMQVYMKRGLQARQKAGMDAFTGITDTFTVDTKTANFSTLSQYEPYYLESSYDRYQESIEQEHMGGGKIVKEKVSDVSITKGGGYQIQAGPTAITRDDEWDNTTEAGP
jgi:hypothetical protein